MKKQELQKAREYKVVKANELVQKSRFELSLTEQKTIAYICSKIKPCKDNNYVLDYEFSIREYCKICGIDYNNGKNYANVKETLKKLSDRSMWVEFGDSEVLCRWLAKVKTNKRSGIAQIRIDEDLAPYLFNLQERFTEYELFNILGMKSAFSHRFYELLKSYEFQKTIHFDLEKLKEILGVENVKSYTNFKDFRKYVIEVALKEINELTDITVTYEVEKTRQKVTGIILTVTRKEPFDRLMAQVATEAILKE